MPENKKEKIFTNTLFYILIFLIIFCGIFIRTRLYLLQAPLWLDEMMLAYSFTDYSFTDIFTKGLEAFQKAPPLFCAIILFIRNLFGINELTLRFIPYISGILALFGFFILLNQHVKNKIGIITGVFLYAFCTPLIYFSTEFKPYGFDAFITIILLLSYKYISFKNLTNKRAILYSICSVIFILLSFPTIFLIPAIIIVKIIEETKKFDWKLLWICGGILSAGLYLYLYDIGTYNYLKDYWENTEKGFSYFPTIGFLWKFMIDACKFYIYNFETNYIYYILIYISCGFGILLKEKNFIAKVSIFTIIFVLIASSIEVYPFKPKLALFLAPIFIIFITKIFDITLYIKNSNKLKYFYSILLCLGLLTIIKINIPYLNLTENDIVYYNKALHGRNKSIEDRNSVKDICLKVLNNIKQNDKILASEEFLYSIKYYKFRYNIDKLPDITTYGYKDNIPAEYILKTFIEQNKNYNLWFIGRNNEQYFKCLNDEDILKVLQKINFKHTIFKKNDIYLMYVNFNNLVKNKYVILKKRSML